MSTYEILEFLVVYDINNKPAKSKKFELRIKERNPLHQDSARYLHSKKIGLILSIHLNTAILQHQQYREFNS